jgi:hypothetical protein
VPTALVAPRAWQRVRDVAGWLPASVAGGFYLECRLGEEDSSVDWIARVEQEGRAIIARRNPRIQLPDAMRTDADWQRITRFCACWQDDSQLRDVISHLWLEFDLAAASVDMSTDVANRMGAFALPVPSLFVAIDKQRARALSTIDWIRLAERLVMLLMPDAPAEDVACIGAVISARPDGPIIPYFGFMLARAPRGVRVYLQGVVSRDIAPVVQRIGWPGDAVGLASLIQSFDGGLGLAPPVGMLHVDVHGGAVSPRVGVEFTLRRRPQLRGQIIERDFLARLVALGWCTPAKERGLLAWPGVAIDTMSHEFWPSTIQRRVNCIKLSYAQGTNPFVKGYLLTRWAAVRRGASSVTTPSPLLS